MGTDNLIKNIVVGKRVCPIPVKWNDLWELLFKDILAIAIRNSEHFNAQITYLSRQIVSSRTILAFISWFDAEPTCKSVIKVKNTTPTATFGAKPPLSGTIFQLGPGRWDQLLKVLRAFEV